MWREEASNLFETMIKLHNQWFPRDSIFKIKCIFKIKLIFKFKFIFKIIVILSLRVGSGANERKNYAIMKMHPKKLLFYIQYNTIQYNTIQYNTIQYNTIQYNTIQYNTIQ